MDFLQDKTGGILDYAFQNDLLPDFVKEASMPTLNDVQDLKDNAFANPIERSYPCHTKEATVLSALYAAANNEDDGILDNIKKMASAYEVDSITNPIFEHFENTFTKIASEKEEAETPIIKFALSLQDENGNVSNHYNISTKEDTLVSIKHLDKDFYCGGISPKHIRKIAKVVLDAAEEYGVAKEYIPSRLIKYAETRMPDVALANSLVSLRKNANTVQSLDAYESVVDELSGALSSSSMTESEILSLGDNAVSQLIDLDNQYNIKYASDQPEPFDIIFSGPSLKSFEKFAAEHVRINAIPVPVVDLVNLSQEKIDTMFTKQSAAIINTAKEKLQGELTVEKSASAATTLQELSPESTKLLLTTLANIGW